MAWTIEAPSAASQTGNSVSSFTLSINAGSGANRVLMVGLGQRTSAVLVALSGASYAGASLAQDISNDETSTTTDIRTSIFSLPNCASGTNTLTVAWAGSVVLYDVNAAVFNGGHQASPLDATGACSAATSTSPFAEVVPTQDGDLIFGVCLHETAVAMSSGSNFTTLFNDDLGAWCFSTEYEIQGTAASRIVDWNSSQNLNYTAVAAAYKVAAAGGNAYVPGVFSAMTGITF